MAIPAPTCRAALAEATDLWPDRSAGRAARRHRAHLLRQHQREDVGLPRRGLEVGDLYVKPIQITVEEAYREACLALGEATVQRRLMEKAASEQYAKLELTIERLRAGDDDTPA